MPFFLPKIRVLCAVLGVVLLAMLGAPTVSAQETRTLAGEVTLDVGMAPADLSIDVTVNNHSFAVVPPSFAIIRPITSTQTRRITIKQGEASARYFVDEIITNPVDYTVGFQCIACADVFRNQYYAESGNRFGFANAVYLDPPSLGPNLDVTIITDVRVSGVISLENDLVAERDLIYQVVIASASNAEIIFLRTPNIRLPEGQSSVSYEVRGLRRQSAASLFSVSLECINCIGRSAKPQIFPEILSPEANYQSIDFTVTDESAIVVAPIIDLLLNQRQ